MSEPESPVERSRQLPQRPSSPTGTSPQYPVTAAGQAPAASTSPDHLAAASTEHGGAPASPAGQSPAGQSTTTRVPPWFSLPDESAPAPDPISDSQLALPLPVDSAVEHQSPPHNAAEPQAAGHPGQSHDSQPHAPEFAAQPHNATPSYAAESSAQPHSPAQPAATQDSVRPHAAEYSAQPQEPQPAAADYSAQPHSTGPQAQWQTAQPEATPQSAQPPGNAPQSAPSDGSTGQPVPAPTVGQPVEASTMVHRTDQLARPSAAPADQSVRPSQPEPAAAPTQYAPSQPQPTQAYAPQPGRPDQTTQYHPQPDQYARQPMSPAPTQVQPPAYGHTGQQPAAPAYGHTGPQSPAYGYPGQRPPAYGHTGPQPPQPVYGHTGPQAQMPVAQPGPPRQPTLQNQEPVGLDHLMGMPGDERTERARPPRGPRPPRAPRPTGAGGPPKNNKGLVFALQILGLVLVALLAGTMWVACSPSGHSQKSPTGSPTASGPTSGPATAGGYTFAPVMQQADTACQPNAYGKAADYFAQHPCTALTRWLFTTTSQSGEKVVTAMAKVQMTDANSAAGLDALVKQDGTGSVGYLTHPGFAAPAGPTRMGKDAGFAATASDTVVLIAESAFLESDTKDEAQLKQISNAAITSQGK